MRLVKIDGIYINPDKVTGLTTDHIGGGHYTVDIFCGLKRFTVHGNIDKVAKALTEVKNDESGSY